MLRILHTSDWHLGHTLHDVPRAGEHAAFLDWLLGVVEREDIDALLVAGDVFDSANPPADAQEAWYRFLATARRRLPALDLVVIGGNHDSAARLDAPDPILRSLDVRVVGGMTRAGAALAADDVIVPLRDRRGETAAWVAAVPFLRPFDLPAGLAGDPFVEGVRAVYARVLDAARARLVSGQALVAMGHLYMTGTQLSELSERKILGGNQHALPVDVFPEPLAYAALGHLHLAQSVGRREGVRYSGSPIPLAMNEASYRHQVVVAQLEGGKLADVRAIEVPRTVPILRVPAGDPAPLDDVLAALAKLEPMPADLEEWKRPYLEVNVSLEKPVVDLRQRIEAALAGKAARLLRIGVAFTGTGRALGDVGGLRTLRDLRPEQVFRDRWAREYQTEPSPEILAAFAELVEIAEGAER